MDHNTLYKIVLITYIILSKLWGWISEVAEIYQRAISEQQPAAQSSLPEPTNLPFPAIMTPLNTSTSTPAIEVKTIGGKTYEIHKAVDGSYHRTGDKPAVIADDYSELYYYKQGMLHNESGAAVILHNKAAYWYIYGVYQRGVKLN